jgi:hypothetical protein
MMARFPTHSVNGYDDVTEVKDPTSGKMLNVPKPTMIVPIPHTTSVLQSEPAKPGLLAPQPTQPRGTGQLKSVGQ